MDGLAAVSAAISDRQHHLGEGADWFCADMSAADARICQSADRLHILNLASLTGVQIRRCEPRHGRYCIHATFSPGGLGGDFVASLEMAGVAFRRAGLAPGSAGSSTTFSSARFSAGIVVSH